MRHQTALFEQPELLREFFLRDGAVARSRSPKAYRRIEDNQAIKNRIAHSPEIRFTNCAHRARDITSEFFTTYIEQFRHSTPLCRISIQLVPVSFSILMFL